ncbi:hypothetical protein E4U34_001433 [Claviceps purpurea]|nr:hypothetical protein E4U12_002325 [Claviceps purpurea]KAG6191626.1 hypothetical protein E4U36_007202 [Claviceps purpurea]KAG6222457.1 hypothetical protein E4U34_001433 [Claviceps purpurea]
MKRTDISAPPTPDPSDKPADTRPETSPYASCCATLRFQNGSEYTVPSALLQKFPKLSFSLGKSTFISCTEDVGHVLTHYLYTDTYQSLRPKGLSSHDKRIAEFTTSVRVYVLARQMGSVPLEELARAEIERLGDGLLFATVVSQMRIAYPEPTEDDKWFSSYLRTRLRTTLEKPALLLACVETDPISQTLPLSDLLLRNLVELIRDQGVSAPVINPAVKTGTPKKPAPATATTPTAAKVVPEVVKGAGQDKPESLPEAQPEMTPQGRNKRNNNRKKKKMAAMMGDSTEGNLCPSADAKPAPPQMPPPMPPASMGKEPHSRTPTTMRSPDTKDTRKIMKMMETRKEAQPSVQASPAGHPVVQTATAIPPRAEQSSGAVPVEHPAGPRWEGPGGWMTPGWDFIKPGHTPDVSIGAALREAVRGKTGELGL